MTEPFRKFCATFTNIVLGMYLWCITQYVITGIPLIQGPDLGGRHFLAFLLFAATVIVRALTIKRVEA